MARVLGYDIETTGLDVMNDRIIEVGACVWDTDLKVPLEIYSSFVSGVEILPSHEPALKINGINPTWLNTAGISLPSIMSQIAVMCAAWGVTHVVAHNGEGYDKPLTLEELKRHQGIAPILRDLPWLDTRYDLPFEVDPTSRKLSHLALDAGFMNPFAHRAVFDVLTMLRVMSQYEFSKIIEHSKIPWIVVRALVDYDTREKAKEFRFSWENIGDKKYPKMWVQKIKLNNLEALQEKAAAKQFKIVRIE